jgi:hypothetical protein
MALVPTSNGNQMIALPIKALSSTNLVNAKQIQIATIGQLNAAGNSIISNSSTITSSTATNNSIVGEHSTGLQSSVPSSTASITFTSTTLGLEQSALSTGIRIPAKLTANIIPICKGELDIARK